MLPFKYLEKNNLLELNLQRFEILLSGFEEYQKDIDEFVKKCKALEDENGLMAITF